MENREEIEIEEADIEEEKTEKVKIKEEDKGKTEKEKVRNIGLRDLEILRTVARLKYVTSRELRNAFFSYDDFGRKRLKILSGQDLIRPHRKGLPKHLSDYSVWRLTTRGLRLIRREFPDEEIPDGFVERAAERSLYNIEHRERTSQIYLDLISCDREHERYVNLQDVAVMRQRADQVQWQADGEVVLRCKNLSKKIFIVPDAVATSLTRPMRCFVELDRSTKSLRRIKHDLEAYRRYLYDAYAQDFPDKRKPRVLYVVRSEWRRESIDKIARNLFLGEYLPLKILIAGKTTDWLQEQLLDLSRISTTLPTQESPRRLLADLWHAASDVIECKQREQAHEKVMALRFQLDRCVPHVN